MSKSAWGWLNRDVASPWNLEGLSARLTEGGSVELPAAMVRLGAAPSRACGISPTLSPQGARGAKKNYLNNVAHQFALQVFIA